MLDNLISWLPLLMEKRDKEGKDEIGLKFVEEKIRNLVTNLHSEVVSFVVTNYDLICIPKFDPSQMLMRYCGGSMLLIILFSL
jgi:hypothetical protein